jgi:alkaline phosphatase
VDFQVPDSSATATAFLCGVKAQMGTAGVSQAVQRGRCDQVKGNEVTSIARWAQLAGELTHGIHRSYISHAIFLPLII